MRLASLFSRPRLVALLTLSALGLIGGWGAWTIATAHYRGEVEAWIEAERAQGIDVSYDEQRFFGLPRRVTMRLIQPRWTTRDGVTFRAEAMDVVASPWNWKRFDVKFKQPATLTAALDANGSAFLLSCESGRLHIERESVGSWRITEMSLQNASLGVLPHAVFHAAKVTAKLTRPAVPPSTHAEAGLAVDGEAETIQIPATMPAPFGTTAQRFAVKLRVMATPPDLRRRATVDAWNKNSGVIEFDDFSLNWGALALAAKGTVGFDGDLQPQGAFAGTLAQPRETLKVLKKQGFVAPQDEALVASTLTLLTKPSMADGAQGTVPFTLQMGGLFLGPVRLFTFPEIEWPIEPVFSR